MTTIREKSIYTLIVIRDNFVLIALVSAIVVFGLTANHFFTIQNLVNIARQTAIISIIACGMTYCIISANIDLSVGSVLALAGLITALVIQATGSIILGVTISLSAGAFIGYLNGVLTTKGNIPSFLTTLGMMGIVRGIAMIITKTRPVVIYKELYWKAFGDFDIWGVLPMPVVWTIIVVLTTHIFLKYTTFGRQIYAVGGNFVAAQYTGIKTDRVIISVFIITSTLSAFAGVILSSKMHTARPNIAEMTVMDVVAAVILGGTSLFGGKGTIMGTLLGALVIGTINNGLIMLGHSTYIQMVVRSSVIILAVLFSSRDKE